jgi:FkbM family methyltransferase
MRDKLRKSAKGLIRFWLPLKPHSFEEQVYSAVLHRNDTVFDIGANYGEVAIYMARAVGRYGKVFAFEPVTPVYREMCENIHWDRYDRAPIIPVPVGLSDRCGTASITVPDSIFGRGSLAKTDKWQQIQKAKSLRCYECDFTTLDALFRKFPKPVFMKIDVEGAELFVLRGGQKAFSEGFRPLMLIEVFAPWEKAFDYGPLDVFSFLEALSYRFLFLFPESIVEHGPSRQRPFPPGYEKGYNIIAFAPEHSERIARLRHLRKILPMAPAPISNVIS